MPSLGSSRAMWLALLQAALARFVLGADLQIETTRPATCSRPTKSGDTISVHYKGRLQATGVEFDQSYKRGRPLSFTLGAGQVIKGWDQGLTDMCPGEARTLTIPPELGYGEFGFPPVIPGGSTLIFETELMDIVGVEQEVLTTSSISQATSTISSTQAFHIATAPPTPEADFGKVDNANIQDPATSTTVATPETSKAASSSTDPKTAQQENEAECHLLGPFALLVQGALGIVALMSLVYKRWRETPKRPWKIFIFDVSKQVIGSMLVHVLNLVMSMLGAVDVIGAAAVAAEKNKDAADGSMPNPCSFYLLNLAIDTTIGIPVLYLLLKVLHGLFLHTPLARPRQSIKSGNYGDPPRTTWWLKQALIYFIGLTGMKLFVWFLFAALPWLPWVGDWALRWTNGNNALQITFAMFIFPLAMNGLQYWIIDSFIMDKSRGNPDHDKGYEPVHVIDDDDDDEEEDDETSDSTQVDVESATVLPKKGVNESGSSAAPLLAQGHALPTGNMRSRDTSPRAALSSGPKSD